MDIPLSSRGLWHIITGRSSLQEPEQIEIELNENRQKLLEGVLWFKQPSTSSLQKLQKSDKIKQKRKELVKKLSKILNLDEWQALELFGSYLENEFRGSKQQLQSICKNETQTENMITKIQEYYFEERLHSLQCLKYLLSYWQDPQHDFREEFSDCIEKLQESDVLIKKVIEQYKMCSASQVEGSHTYNSPLERNRNSRLALQYLREQVLLLEIIFLYYKEYLHPSKYLQELANIFQSQGFGTKQMNRHLLDARAELLAAQISYLQVLILIESLNLEGVRNLMDTGNFKQHHLVQEPGGVELLDRFFVGWGDLSQHGPVMLAWAVFRYVTMETDQEQDIRRIGSKALQCPVFEFFDSMLKSEAFSGMSPVSNTCKSVVYGLLFVVLTMFQEDTLGNTKLLVSVLSQTLSERGLCIDFWDTSLDTGAGLLLKSASNTFPLQFSPLLELLKSLAGEENSAAKVFDYLENMLSYTELLRENKVGDVDCTGDDQVWKIVKPKKLYRGVQSYEQPLVIPSQTLGALLPVLQGSAVIRWNYSYSCWKLFVFEIDSFLQSVSLGAGLKEDNVIAIIDLTNEILKNNWSKAEHLEPIISRLYFIVQRCAPSPNPPQNLIASCLSCLATVASHHPMQVWFSLQQTGFLPHCTTAQSIDDNKATIESMNIASGNLGVILSTREQPLGQYPITMATLRLLLQLMCGIGQAQEVTEQPVNFLDLAACLVFVLREVFTGFHKWKFTAAKDREEIGQRSLEIFNAVLGLQLTKPPQKGEDEMDIDISEARQQIRSASVLQDVLAFSLLNTAAGQSLLHILGTGVDTVDRLISLGGSTGSYALAVIQLIKLAFSVLNKLLARKHKDEEISPLEQALSTQVIHQFKDSSNVYSGSSTQSHLVTVIASYIHHRADCRLPTLATLLLKRLCMVAPMSMYASFGSDAVALRDVFVSRLRSLTEDVKLKIAILEFIATAVETQPGLIELFLNLKEKDKNTQVFTLGDRSCLHAVLSMVDPTKQSRLPAALVSSAFMLLHSLWFDRRDAALTAIRSSGGFWQFSMQPLFADIDIEEEEENVTSPHLQTCSYAFQILALETYYVSSGQLDASMKTSLKTFASKQRYQYWSSLLKSDRFQEESAAHSRPFSPLFYKSSENEYLRLLRSWRSFLVVASTVESDAYGLRDPKTRNEILKDTLEALKIKVSRPVTLDVLAAAHELSSLYLMLFNKWKSSVKTVSCTFNTLVEILESAHNNDVQLLSHIRIPVFSSISILLQHTRSDGDSGKLDSEYAMALLPLACEPLEYLNGRLGKGDKKHDKVLELSVFIIDEILNILLSNPGQWLPVLREHALFASLVQALDVCVKTREKLEFSEAVLHLFLSLSRIPVSAEALALNNLSQTLCLGVASLFNALQAENQSEGSHQRLTNSIQISESNGAISSRSDWTNVWHLSLAVMASMLRTLRHGFLKDVLDFAGVHRERLARAMDVIRVSQSTRALQEAEDVTVFLFELGHFSKQWRFALPDVQQLLLSRVGVLCQTCIALLTHPRLLAHLLEMSAGNPLQKGSQPLSNLSQSLSSSFSARELLRTYSYADEDTFRNNPVVSNTQTKMLKILCYSLAMLRQFTPDICEILLDEGMDIDEYLPIATLGFSSPAIDREEPLSFGTLLACLNMCLTNLSPGDVRSPVKSPVKTLSETLPKFLLMFAVENALVLALTQASRYLRDPSVDPRVKQLLKRELGSELGHFLGGLNRHFVRRGLPTSPLSERTSPSSSSKKTPTKPPAFSEAHEQRFFKLADLYVKKLLR